MQQKYAIVSIKVSFPSKVKLQCTVQSTLTHSIFNYSYFYFFIHIFTKKTLNMVEFLLSSFRLRFLNIQVLNIR